MKNNYFILIFFAFALVLFAGFASAYKADVAYIITQNTEIKQPYIDSMNELGLTYNVIKNTAINASYTGTNLSRDYKMMLLNDEYFTNWAQIPVNKMPAVLINSLNMDMWGWTTRITSASTNNILNVNLNKSYEITEGLNENIQAYNSIGVDYYLLSENYVYNGIKIAAYTSYNSNDVLVGFVPAGTNLTRGTKTTNVSANSVFFGLYQTDSWTNDTKQLFKNCLMWAKGDDTFDIPLRANSEIKYNLVSFPLILQGYNLNNLLTENPQIVSVKTYDKNTGQIITATSIENQRGYFIEPLTDSNVTISGKTPNSLQTINLVNGMNLVGFNSVRNIPLSELPSQVTEVSKRLDNGRYQTAVKYNSGWFNATFELEPGIGYWFKTNGEVDWSYTP